MAALGFVCLYPSAVLVRLTASGRGVTIPPEVNGCPLVVYGFEGAVDPLNPVLLNNFVFNCAAVPPGP